MAQDLKNKVRHQEQRRLSDRIFTVPVQCEENPEGQNGCVIFENSSYRLFLAEGYVEDRGHQTSAHHETLTVPVQCEENPEGRNGCVIFENRLFLLDGYVEDCEHQTSAHHETLKTPVQCVENPGGQNGYVIADSGSYRLIHGHRSSEHHDTLQNATTLEDHHMLYGLFEDGGDEQMHTDVDCLKTSRTF